MFNELMNGDMLTTFVGLTTATTVIVQFTKSIVKRKFGDHAVRIYAFLIALILTFTFAKDSTGVQSIILAIINSLVITTASMGGYEVLSDPLARKYKS